MNNNHGIYGYVYVLTLKLKGGLLLLIFQVKEACGNNSYNYTFYHGCSNLTNQIAQNEVCKSLIYKPGG